MAAQQLLRGMRLLRLHPQQQISASTIFEKVLRPCSTSAVESAPSGESASAPDNSATTLGARNLPEQRIWDESEYRKWKEEEEMIKKDIEPVISLAKDILHSRRYLDGERLTAEDEKAVVEKLLAYHPNSEDKIGCGLDSIMVDKHPKFRRTRCMFVVRTDGGWIDFSYLKCLKAYIRDKYPSHAEMFITEHFKGRSG